MPIKHAPPPPNGMSLIGRHLKSVIANTPAHIHGSPEDLFHVRVTEPYPGYHYELDDLVAKKGLDQAHLTTWNYLVYDTVPELEPLGIAHLDVAPDGSVSFHGMTSGPIVRAVVAALVFAETHQHTAKEHFELRKLVIPALQFVALWFHQEDTGVHHLLPIFDHFDGLKRETFYTWNEVVAALRPYASRRQGFVHRE